MEGPAEPDDQLTADNRAAAAAPFAGSRGRAPLVLCALAVVAASLAAAWWLGVVAAVAVYASGTLVLVAALLLLARRRGAVRLRNPGPVTPGRPPAP